MKSAVQNEQNVDDADGANTRKRTASVTRKTKERDISIRIDLDTPEKCPSKPRCHSFRICLRHLQS